ncbi:MAG: exonuclease domain-containing protein [Georgfuchsia sp.]
MSQPLVFVDLETTGATITGDRITEIGIVEVSDAGVTEWSTLVNPETRISEFIERLTGISNRMVEDAPTFAEVADEVMERLQGRLFIAHNARFDYGFLKNEFKRAGRDFRATVLCTVKLSRRLYPSHIRHNLDALIARHGLSVSDRHRALGDARLIWQFWQKLLAERGSEVVEAAVAVQTARPSLPPHLDANLLDELPEGHGVYLFYAENDLPLYIGKSNTLCQRVLSHFSRDHASGKEMSISQQVRRIEWIETTGELGALLKEAELVKKLQPTHNQRLRQNQELCTWRLQAGADGILEPELLLVSDLKPENGERLYGLFKSQRAAKRAIQSIAEEHELCLAILGLEKVTQGRPCFAYQIHKCRGACAGQETPEQHNLRLLTALRSLSLKAWPYDGPVGVKEGKQMHVIDHWRYLGTALADADMEDILSTAVPVFDSDTYKLLLKFIGKRKTKVVKLKRPDNFTQAEGMA